MISFVPDDASGGTYCVGCHTWTMSGYPQRYHQTLVRLDEAASVSHGRSSQYKLGTRKVTTALREGLQARQVLFSTRNYEELHLPLVFMGHKATVLSYRRRCFPTLCPQGHNSLLN